MNSLCRIHFMIAFLLSRLLSSATVAAERPNILLILVERSRLVEWRPCNKPTASALYDYQTDPLETRNLAADLPDIVKML